MVAERRWPRPGKRPHTTLIAAWAQFTSRRAVHARSTISLSSSSPVLRLPLDVAAGLCSEEDEAVLRKLFTVLGGRHPPGSDSMRLLKKTSAASSNASAMIGCASDCRDAGGSW